MTSLALDQLATHRSTSRRWAVAMLATALVAGLLLTAALVALMTAATLPDIDLLGPGVPDLVPLVF